MAALALTERERLILERAKRVFGAQPTQTLPPLMQWIPSVSPELDAPEHLAPVVEAIERIKDERIELCFSVPPRHFKSTTVLHAICWLLKRDPTLRILYATFNLEQADDQIKDAKRIAERAGIEFGSIDRRGRWTTSAGGVVRGVGLNTKVNGAGYHLVIVDDPHAGRREAESRAVRSGVISTFFEDIYTRRLPPTPTFHGTSFIVIHTRWTPDDLIGVISKQAPNFKPFQYINLPAEDHEGRALAPRYWPIESLANFKRNQRSWWSLYQGRPQPTGSAVFEGTSLYEPNEVPTGCRYAIGVDMAFSAKASADFSVAVVLARSGDGRVFVVDAVREQCLPREFASHLLRLQRDYPGAPMRWYASGPESGVADLLRDLGVTRLQTFPAKDEKRVRALPVSDAWREGRVMLPRAAPGRPAPKWVDDFADEVLSFTGQGDAHDDQVDALAAGFDALDTADAPVSYTGSSGSAYRAPSKPKHWGSNPNIRGGSPWG
jgi:predicted phage terminase large subunit-like protein